MYSMCVIQLQIAAPWRIERRRFHQISYLFLSVFLLNRINVLFAVYCSRSARCAADM